MAEEEPPHDPHPSKMPASDEKPPPPYHHPPPHRRRRYYPAAGRDPRRTICSIIVILLLLLGIIALTLWLVYRPHHPKFRVISAAVYQLNTSSPPFIAASVQFTVVIRNPNRRVTMLYDPFSAYVAYRNQAITPPVALPPLFQETKSTVALAPLLGGAPVPVPAELANALAMDEAYGVVALRLVMTGKVRYKAGAFKSGRHGVYVACDMLVSLKKGFVGELPLLGSPPCNVYL